MVVCDCKTDYKRKSVYHSFCLYVQISKPIFFEGFQGRDHLIRPSQKKINLGRLVMLTNPFFSYLKFCFGGWFSVSTNSFSELRKRARNPTPPPPSGFCFFFLTSLECERVTTLQRDWVGGWMVGWLGGGP